jgi:hypothetical protein
MQAITRYGEFFEKGELVRLVDYPVIYGTLIGDDMQIAEIKEWASCESGFMIKLKHLKSGNELTNWLDTNWIQKIKG